MDVGNSKSNAQPRLAKRWARIHEVLEPDEQIQIVIPGESGLKPQLGWVVELGATNRPRLIVVTDRAVVVLKASLYGLGALSVVVRLPPQTILGPVKGRSTKLNIPHHQIYVEHRHYELVEKADAIARKRAAT